MIIHGPHENIFYDKDIGPVILSDWYHGEYFDLVEQVMTPVCAVISYETIPSDIQQFAPPPFSDNNLINGKMDYDCSLIPAGGPSCKYTPTNLIMK